MQLIDSINSLRQSAIDHRTKSSSTTFAYDTNTANLLLGELAGLIQNEEKNSSYSDPICFSIIAKASQFIIEVNGKYHCSSIMPTEEPTETLSKIFVIFEEQLWNDYSFHLANNSEELVGRTRFSRKTI